MKIFSNWTFKWWEVGILKIGLISLGILLGIYFGEYISGLSWLWWLLFIATAIYFLVRMFGKNNSDVSSITETRS
ncbi:MAG TPA: hypothetical protein PKA60_01485 [Candidatus Paceibacterota bacterium]|nr:hypothetical protein [Candidatus Paceibacterota bacterium]